MCAGNKGNTKLDGVWVSWNCNPHDANNKGGIDNEEQDEAATETTEIHGDSE